LIDLITCRGTGEPVGGERNTLGVITAALDPQRFQVLGDCAYPASIGPANQGLHLLGDSEDASVQAGVESLAQLIRSTDNQVGVLGYSLGAVVVTAFREAQARGEYPDCELAFSACLANPRRRPGDSIDPEPFGSGIDGPHADFGGDAPHFEAANPRDAITSCPLDSPLRTLADGMSAFSIADLGGWTVEVVDRLLRRRWQPTSLGALLHPVRTWQLYDTAATDVRGYLWGGTHTHAYIADGYCERLAAAINRL